MALPILLPIAGVALVCGIIKARPSTLVRVAEDCTLGAAKSVKRRAKGLAHAVRVEYQARSIVRLQKIIATEAQTLRELSPEERKILAADQAEIFRRAEELRSGRETGYYARRAKAEARTREAHPDIDDVVDGISAQVQRGVEPGSAYTEQ